MTHTSTEQPELLPCPFCGDHAETDFIPEHHSYAIECHGIGCAARVIKETVAEAVAAWNLRAQASQARVPLSEMKVSYEAHEECPGDWTSLQCKHSWLIGFSAGFRASERCHGITQEKQG